jgi:fibronectin type III domain protein
MQKVKRNIRMTCDLTRTSRLLAAAALVGVLMTACGDGGGDVGNSASPSAAAPPGSTSPSAAAPPGSASPSATAPPETSGANGALAAVASAKGATTLSWIPPTTNDDGSALKLTGYRIYWGLNADNLTSSVTLDNPGLTRYVVEQLTPATYYFVATALSKDGESEPSNVIAMKVN